MFYLHQYFWFTNILSGKQANDQLFTGNALEIVMIRISVWFGMDFEVLRVARILREILFQIRNDLIRGFQDLGTNPELFSVPLEPGEATVTQVAPPGPISQADHSQDIIYTYRVDRGRDHFSGLSPGDGDNGKAISQQRMEGGVYQCFDEKITDDGWHIIQSGDYLGN